MERGEMRRLEGQCREERREKRDTWREEKGETVEDGERKNEMEERTSRDKSGREEETRKKGR